MKKLLLVILLFLGFNAFCQQNFTISGFVRDSLSGEELIGAAVFVRVGSQGVITNEYGFYSFTLPEGTHEIEYSYLGYKSSTETILLTANTKRNIQLSNQIQNIDEVVVTAKTNEVSTQCKQMSIKQIEQTPTTFGVPDVIKAMQVQPGIKNIGDGSSSMYVRGGNRDQNMVYIDEATIYNISHLYGYVSTFNPNMLKDVKFYNSYIPTEFGGRLSSVLDTKMKEGNMNSYNGEITLSTLTANASVEGPIIKNKSSFFIAVRRSTLDLILNKISDDMQIPNFYDLNSKINYKINDKNRIFLSAYNSKDILNFNTFTNTSQNTSSTLRWIHELNPNIFLNTSYIYSNYSNITEFNDTSSNTWKTGVRDNSLKSKIIWYNSMNQKVTGGIQFTLHEIVPGNSGLESSSISNMNLLESAVFVNHDMHYGNLYITYGIRYSLYQNIGKAIWYSLDQTYKPISKNIENGGIWNTRSSLEPRINIAYKKNSNELAVSYTRTSQAMQVLSNMNLAYSSIETWFCSSPNTPLITSDNIAVSYSYQKKQYKFLAEIYGRNINNQIDYIDNARLYGNPLVESQIRTGNAYAYGSEVSVQKTEGKTKVSASYTFSRIWYSISGITNEKKYRAPYDMPHDIKIQVSQDINKRITLTTLWVFSSGRPGTFPIGFYYTEEKNITNAPRIPIYGARNANSYPNYHRLDFSITIKGKPRKHLEQNFSFGIYNVYKRENPLYYNFDYWSSLQQQNMVLAYYFPSFLPNFTYRATIK